MRTRCALRDPRIADLAEGVPGAAVYIGRKLRAEEFKLGTTAVVDTSEHIIENSSVTLQN